MANNNDSDQNIFCWNDDDAKELKYSKNDILKSSNAKHFDSSGEYYSFGNKGNFGIVNNSSVGICASKSYKSINNKAKAKKTADKMESSTANEVDKSVTNLSGIVPNLHKLLSPVLNVDYNIRATHGDFNFKKVQTT